MNIHLKFILLGDSSVGKTSIFIKYTDNVFKDCFTSTVGIDNKIKAIKYKGYNINSTIYDTAGQEKYRAIISNYYNNVNGVFLVFDLTNLKSFENLNSWIEEVNSSQSNSNIIILGNKSDLNDIIRVTDEDISDFENNTGLQIIKTSAKDGINIEEAFIKMFDLVIGNKNEKQICNEFCKSISRKKLLKSNTYKKKSKVKCC